MAEPLRLDDYYRLRAITEVALSPDGHLAVFGLRAQRRREDDQQSSLWIVPTDGSEPAQRLTRGPGDARSAAFSPDGRLLAFLGQRPHESEVAASLPKEEAEHEPRAQIWVLDLARGGEARQVTAREEGVAGFDWAPDGRRLVVAARAPTDAQRAYLRALRDRSRPGPYVLRRTQHKHDTRGFLDEVATHLFTVDLESRAERQLTDGPCDEGEPRWSPDGRWIAFTSNRTGDPDNNRRTDLWLAAADGDGGGFRRLTCGDVAARWPRWSPDGRRLAFVSSLEPESTYRLSLLMTVAAGGGQELAALPVGEGFASVGGIVGDTVAGDPVAHAHVYPVPLGRSPVAVLTEGLDRPVVGAPAWAGDDALLAPVGDRGQTVLVRCEADGRCVRVHPAAEDRLCTLGAVDAAGGVTVAVVDRPETGPDLWRVGGGRLTDVNPWLRQRRLLPARWVQAGAAEALVLGEVSASAPLLVAIHGGPQAYDSPGLRFDRQYWAGQGYVVVMVNYRGSISYGEAFCRAIQGDWGPREHADVMAGVDAVLARGWADPARLYCTGFSQGGIMTNWAVGHTDRFRAAVSEHGMWDYRAAFGTDDCHLWWQDDLGVPWQNEAAYARISPASGAAAIRTPLLITAGEHDWRCPLDQAELLYITLKKRGVPSELVVYQGEHHAISRPARAIDRLRRIGAWLARYGGQPLAAADAADSGDGGSAAGAGRGAGAGAGAGGPGAVDAAGPAATAVGPS